MTLFEPGHAPLYLGLPAIGVCLYLAVQHGLLWRQDPQDLINKFVWWWSFCTLWLVAGRLGQKATADPVLAMVGLRFQVTVAVLSLGALSWFAARLGGTSTRRALLPMAVCFGVAALSVGTDVVITSDLYIREDAVGARFWAATPGPGLALLPLLAVVIIPWLATSVMRSTTLSGMERQSLAAGLIITLLLVLHDLAMVWRLLVSVQLVELVPVPMGLLASQTVLRRHREHRLALAAQVDAQTKALRDANATLQVALQQAHQSQHQLLTVQNACSDAMVVVLPDQGLVPLNAAAHALLGDVKQPSLDSVLPGLPLSRDGSNPSATVSTPGPPARSHDVRQAPLGDGSTLLMVRDITAQRDLETKLATAERLSALGNVVAGMAHAINNPLGYVLSNAESLLERTSAKAPAADDITPQLRDVLDGAQRVAGIVRELQDVSRALPVVPGPVELGGVVQLAIAATQARTGQIVPINVRLDGDTWVMGHGPQLVQVMTNIIGNALDALETMSPNARGMMVVTAAHNNSVTTLELADAGPGMEPAVAARALEPFFTTKAVGKGAGLGLWTSYELCRQMGASLSIQSNAGKGTVVSVALPSAQRPAHVGQPPPSPKPPPARRLRILVVDDEPGILRAMVRALAPHEVVCCTTGEKALAQTQQDDAFDLVLCDVMMPSMTGPALKEILLARHPQLARRLVFYTGGATDNQAGGPLGDTPVLRKPMPVAELRAAVTELAARLGDSTG